MSPVASNRRRVDEPSSGPESSIPSEPSRSIATIDSGQERVATVVEAWRDHLFFVDEVLIRSAIQRLLADESLRESLTRDGAFKLMKGEPDLPSLGALNEALLAKCLLAVRMDNPALPYMGSSCDHRIGEIVRVKGLVRSVEPRTNGSLILRIASQHSALATALLLRSTAREGWRTAEMRDQTVVSFGFLHRPRYRHVAAAAAAIRQARSSR